MADNDDQSRSDNIYYMRLLHERACKALCIDPDRNSWFDIVEGLELLASNIKPLNWCCNFAERTNGWNHDSDCKNYVVVY